MRFIKMGFKMLLVFASFLVIILVCLLVFLWINSPGKPEKYIDSKGLPLNGSISEKIFVPIGCVRQGMFIKSKNLNNPVLLYIHGGPAFPNYFLIDKYKPGLEDYFTVCYWEQRGGGLSFSNEVTAESMTLEQLSADAIELSRYLKNRFGKEKIYMMAHSGGTLIALLSAQKVPELYHAYIAMAQITNQAESEKIAYRYMLDKYESLGKKRAIKKLLSYKVLDTEPDILNYYHSVSRDQFMHELGIGTMHKMNSIFKDIFIPVWTCKAYTLREKINIWKSKFSFLPTTSLRKETIENDFAKIVPSLDIPVYFISGRHDLTVNINLSKEYFSKFNAPLKGFYTFIHSAHSPIYEEPARLREILIKDVLANRNDLADKE